MTTPRGIRNNNPGNIDFNKANQWQGQKGIEPGPNGRFAVFDTPENGIRALGKLLINYRGKDGMPGVGGPGIDTVRETINRWAPAKENNTEAYIQAVSRKLGVQPNDKIDITKEATLRVFVISIIEHENGMQPYSVDIINEGIRRALK
jgi:hypothetical protein